MTSSVRFRAFGAVVIVNLGAFVLITSLPAFQSAHHHWIFPILAAMLAGEWALTLLAPPGSLAGSEAVRSDILSTLALIVFMGVVRHATILACFERCGFKLSAAAAVAGAVFFGQRLRRDGGFWGPLRSGLAATAGFIWAPYLALRAFQLAPWTLNLGFGILALLFWLGRTRPVPLIASLGICAALAIRATANEYAIIGLSALLLAAAFGAAPRVEAWLQTRAARPVSPAAPSGPLRLAAIAVLVAGLGIYVVGPVFLMTDAAGRQARLNKLAPAFPIQDPSTLSPLAARLRAHVLALSETIGERDAYQRAKQARARDYVIAQLKALGYAPKALAYESRFMPSVKDGTIFSNVEARLTPRPADVPGVWILGAHYDTVPGTPGADDNASGVAVLLETARLLKDHRPAREIRFVAFGTEEPPSFGTRNMGSDHYAQGLKDSNAKVLGLICLEMLGYYNPRGGSQLYPPFLHLFNPADGGFVAAVGNVSSRGLLDSFQAAWRRGSSFPLTTAILPGPFAGLALSDQLNFWDQGYPALMLSDTAFYRNPNYHEASDLARTLDYERMAEVTRALAAAVKRQTKRL